MFMLILCRYITGYVKFCGTGVFPERFLNLCARDGIIVWNPRINLGRLSGCMRVRDYKRIRSYAKKSGMRLRVRKRVGLVFVLNRYRRRYGIAVGAAVFVLIVWFLSGFCLNISVVGNEKISEKHILNALAAQGVCVGRRMNDIEPESARQRFLIANEQFAWAAFNKRGSFLSVEIRETTKKQMKNKIKYPCNIVASRSGKILRIKAYEGSVSVMVNEAVRKGDLLVSGVIELTDKSTKFVSANAQVIALTEYELSVFVPYTQVINIRTDEKITHRVLNIAGLDIPLFLGGVKAPYEVKRTEKDYMMWGVRLPIKMTKATFVRTVNKKIQLSKSAAEKLAVERMENKANRKFRVVTHSEKGVFTEVDGGVKYKKTYFCEENIAKIKKILK